ncbi:MAG: nuclear transport factor 2 family protein [Flavobacteriales bacterium]|nr:MAG: nuclear transport factor 2 family protein [Flavobacteriales bacterium]
MKKFVLPMVLFICAIATSQKEKNGTIYIKHPTIDMTNEMLAAYVAGDAYKVATFLADDFKAYNGNSTNKDNTGRTKEEYLEGIKWWRENIAYFSMKPSGGAYPDALEYKDGTFWVQTWNDLSGVHNETGVRLDMPVQYSVQFNKDNKIKTLITYNNNNVFQEIRRSYGDRKNGVLYDHHDNINKVRRMMSAFENKDLDLAYSYFAPDCRFTGLEVPDGESMDLEQVKERNNKIWEAFDISSIDVVGYPDYLEYDLGDSKAVQSWWKFRMTRKSDGKKIVMPALYIHDFNDEGQIIRSNAYMSTKILDAK